MFPLNVKAFDASGISVKTGILDNGDLDSILTNNDGNILAVSEVNGVPGFDIRVNFTGVNTPFQSITVNEKYFGGANHVAEIELYNYTSASWDSYITIEDSIIYHTTTRLVPEYEHYVLGGLVQLRFYHYDNGNAAHDQLIDYVALNNLDGWLDGWGQRIPLTINSSLVDETLVNFPVLLHLSRSSGNTNADVARIFDRLGNDENATAYTMGDGLTRLYFEVETWDFTSKEAWIWTRVYNINNVSDTTLYFYYNVTADGSSWNSPRDVWTSFNMVQHMNDETNATIQGSTVSGYVGNKEAANTPLESTGQIGNAQNFNVINTEYINLGDILSVNFEPFTVSVWINPDVTNIDQAIFDKGSIDGGFSEFNKGYYTIIRANSKIMSQIQDVDSQALGLDGMDTDAGDWLFFVMIVNRNTNLMYRYKDTVLVGTTTNIVNEGNLSSARDFTIGCYSINFAFLNFDGGIDELRISFDVKTIGWLDTSYESDLDNLLTYGSIESVPLTGDDAFAIAFALIIIAIILAVAALLNRR